MLILSSNDGFKLSPPTINHLRYDRSNFLSLVLVKASKSVGTPKIVLGLVCFNNLSNFLASNAGLIIAFSPKHKGLYIHIC